MALRSISHIRDVTGRHGNWQKPGWQKDFHFLLQNGMSFFRAQSKIVGMPPDVLIVFANKPVTQKSGGTLLRRLSGHLKTHGRATRTGKYLRTPLGFDQSLPQGRRPFGGRCSKFHDHFEGEARSLSAINIVIMMEEAGIMIYNTPGWLNMM